MEAVNILGRFILGSLNFSSVHKSKFSIYFVLANSCNIYAKKISKNFISKSPKFSDFMKFTKIAKIK